MSRLAFFQLRKENCGTPTCTPMCTPMCTWRGGLSISV